jgi:uncharacterized membrane protein YhaH (DUF805 family)
MFAFIYFFCAIISLVEFITGWDKARNKLKSIAGCVIALIPLLNLIMAIAVITHRWPKIKAWTVKYFG